MAFNGRQVVICAETAPLAEQLQELFRHLPGSGFDGEEPLLRLHLRALGDNFFELEEYEQRREQGSLAYILHCAREWITSAFITSCPDLLWLHAGAAMGDGRAVLLPGAAGAGKSTLTAGLVARGWSYLADDIVPVDPLRHCMLSFPFTPAVRAVPYHEGGNWREFLRQEKAHLDIHSEQISTVPVPVGSIIFPEYSADVPGEVILEPISTMAATQALMTQCIRYETRKEQTIGKLFALARSAPSFRLAYSNPGRAVNNLAQFDSQIR